MYHVISRSNTGDIVFRDKRDWGKFFYYVSRYAGPLSMRIHSWCLMDTHFHLLLESSNRPCLSEFMRRLLTAYTIYFNRRHGRHGHLFQGRFKSHVVDKKAYLLSLSRYIHLNPAHLNLKTDPSIYEGSSLPFYVNGQEPDFLYSREILSFFKGNRKKYEKFVREGLDKKIKLEIVNQRYLGDEAFVNRMRKRIGYGKIPGSKFTKAQRKMEEAVENLDEEKARRIVKRVAGHFNTDEKSILKSKGFHGEVGRARSVILALLHKYVPWTYQQLAAYLGLKNKSAIDYHLRKMRNNRECRDILKDIENNKGLKF